MKRPLFVMLLAWTLFPAPDFYAASTNLFWRAVGISEFMADNRSTVLDSDGDASGWIEIFNPTTNNVSLNGWSLTDDTNNLRKWQFPNVTIPSAQNANGADNYLVVFASGKNRTNAAAELHANFKLSPGGGFLALVGAGTARKIVSVFDAYPPQTADVAYGRDVVHPNITGSFPSPSPGQPNLIGGANFSSAVAFSRTGGTFITPFSLQLAASNNATIYYTLDGSVPTPDATIYTNPLAISRSVQVRTRAFGDGLMPGPLHSETYLQLDASVFAITSSLPAVIIYNFGGGKVPLSKSVGATDQWASVSFVEPQNGLTWLTNPPTLSARGGIHVHGTSTALLPKQAYSLNFHDELENDENHAPLGLPSESAFVLYATDNEEPVLIHNPLIYQLSNEIGRYASRTRFVEVYLNTNGGAITASNYNGLYVLEEKIKWDKNRVNIPKIRSVDNLNPMDNSPSNVTGGYILRIDRLDAGEFGLRVADQIIGYDYPKEADITTPQRAPQVQYLKDYLTAFNTALKSAHYTNATNGYRAFVDVPSWIDYHILNTVVFNVDALKLSAYFYKDRTNKLVFGPIWDFDRSQGSTDGQDFNPFNWCLPSTADFFGYTWWGRMFTDIDFWQAWIDRYEDLRGGVLSTNHICANIDALVAQVRAEQPREVARWPKLTSPRSGVIKIRGYSYTFPGTYQGEVDFIKKWYGDRLHFMDTNLLAKPVFDNTSGAMVSGSMLGVAGPKGATIYYTTNGADPRLPGGGIASNALAYTAPIALPPGVTIMARAYNSKFRTPTGSLKPRLSSPWSGLTSETFSLATPPVAVPDPANLEAYVGQNPTLAVKASGSPAPAYQWAFDDLPLPGETNAQLTLASVQTNQSGTYSVTVTNFAGGTNLPLALVVTPKPNLVVTEVMSSEVKGAKGSPLSTSDWWELSNLGGFPVRLQGYRFDDNHDSFSDADTITSDVTIQPGESIVFVEDMTADDFRTWWGPANLPPNLQIITYPSIGFSASGDAVNLWNAAANAITDTVASVAFPAAQRGVSFGYDPATQLFGGLSVLGQGGAFAAAVNGDIGSPGTFFLASPLVTVGRFKGAEGFSLSFVTQSNCSYRVEYKNKLIDPAWMDLSNFTACSNVFILKDATATTNAGRFYRVVAIP